MDIKVLGVDLGKTVCSLAGLANEAAALAPTASFAVLLGWTKQERSWFANASSDIGYLPFWMGCHPALLRWKPAEARITSGAFAFRLDMSPD